MQIGTATHFYTNKVMYNFGFTLFNIQFNHD